LKLHAGTRLISDLGTQFAALLGDVSSRLSAAHVSREMTIKTIYTNFTLNLQLSVLIVFNIMAISAKP